MGPSRRLFWTNEPFLEAAIGAVLRYQILGRPQNQFGPLRLALTQAGTARPRLWPGQASLRWQGEAVVESRSLLVPVRFGPNDYALFPSLQVIVSETVTRTLFLALRLTISGIRVMRLCRNRQKNRELKYNRSVNHGINIITWSL